MASKRKLKKIMQFISSELITDVFFKTLMSGKEATEKADLLVVEISQFTREHIGLAVCFCCRFRGTVLSSYTKVY